MRLTDERGNMRATAPMKGRYVLTEAHTFEAIKIFTTHEDVIVVNST